MCWAVLEQILGDPVQAVPFGSGPGPGVLCGRRDSAAAAAGLHCPALPGGGKNRCQK